jgi:hypothetical protein
MGMILLVTAGPERRGFARRVFQRRRFSRNGNQRRENIERLLLRGHGAASGFFLALALDQVARGRIVRQQARNAGINFVYSARPLRPAAGLPAVFLSNLSSSGIAPTR